MYRTVRSAATALGAGGARYLLLEHEPPDIGLHTRQYTPSCGTELHYDYDMTSTYNGGASIFAPGDQYFNLILLPPPTHSLFYTSHIIFIQTIQYCDTTVIMF